MHVVFKNGRFLMPNAQLFWGVQGRDDQSEMSGRFCGICHETLAIFAVIKMQSFRPCLLATSPSIIALRVCEGLPSTRQVSSPPGQSTFIREFDYLDRHHKNCSIAASSQLASVII